ncbi:hypothetical protein BDV93DRAFT_516383 [Ceratobasidium sp. AG-I]|nr:hypothetical protein BDV93DRAFT_516383 [Ceratobasidium sp. AG-I]
MSQPSTTAPEKASAVPNDKADLGGHDALANPDTQQTNPNKRPKRKTIPTVRGELDAKERATDRQQHEDRMHAKKRKMAAEARGNASQPGPLPQAPKRPKGKRNSENILEYWSGVGSYYGAMDCGGDATCQALSQRGPITDEKLKLPTVELMEMWTDVPDANVVKRINDNYRNIEVTGNSQCVVPDPVRVKTEGRVVSNPVHVKIEGANQALTPDRRAVSGAKLQGTDHKTIGIGNARPFSEHPRASNGKPGLIEGAPIMTDDEIREFRMKYGHLDLSDFKQLKSTDPTPRHHPFPPSSRPPGPPNPSDKPAAAKASSAPRTNPGPPNNKFSLPSGAIYERSTRNNTAKRAPELDRPGASLTARQAQRSALKRAGAQPKPAYTNVAPRPWPVNPRLAQVDTYEENEEDNNEDVVIVEEEDGTLAGSKKQSNKETKKSQAQLCKFGPAESMVQLLKERVHLFVLVKCGFADILPSNTYIDPPPYADAEHEAECEDDRHIYANLLDKWLATEWEVLHRKKRRGLPPLELEDPHCRHVCQQMSRFRNENKAALQPLIPLYYGLKKPGFHRSNIELVESLLPSAFHHSDTAAKDRAYHHPIIRDTLLAICFNRGSSSLGIKYPAEFTLIPLATIALICSIARHLILEFGSGEYCSSSLRAEDQAPYYQKYLNDLRERCQPTAHGKRIRKLRRALYMDCITTTPAVAAPEPKESEAKEWGPDSDDSEPEGYENFKLLPREETPPGDSPSPPNAPPTPSSAPRQQQFSRQLPPARRLISPVAGPSRPSFTTRHSAFPTDQVPGTPGSEEEMDELDDDPTDLSPEDQIVYYGEGEETMKED